MSVLSLRKSDGRHRVDGPVVVVVMDGVGVGVEDEGNAVWLARTPILDALGRTVPTRQLRAHGTAVGLPSDDDMGNSEVGHNALGAGRVFEQGAKLVNQSIASGAMFESETWRWLVDGAREHHAPVHFMGLLSDGNVHSHVEHLYAMIRRCHADGVQSVRVHALLDGRDVPETSALTYVDALEGFLKGFAGRDYRVASGGGRMKVTMDRYEADWSMVARGWKAHVHGEGRGFRSLREAVLTLREENPAVIDQNLPGFVIVDAGGAPVGPIRDGSSVVFFNFRGDRAIEITRAFEQEVLAAFDRTPRPAVRFAGMMQYDGDLKLPSRYLVTPPAIDRTLGEYLATEGVGQLAISETQKYGHVTYFWNGNRTEPFDPKCETYVEIPSDLRPFEERPWMKAAEITDRLIDELKTGRFRHARVNYPNGDMVGHTGVRDAAVMAVEAVDLQLGRLIPVVLAMKGAVLVTADHGNADEMFELDKKSKKALLHPDGRPKAKTSHTLNAVPLHIAGAGAAAMRGDLPTAGLSNVAATVLDLLGYETPEGYDPSLLGG